MQAWWCSELPNIISRHMGGKYGQSSYDVNQKTSKREKQILIKKKRRKIKCIREIRETKRIKRQGYKKKKKKNKRKKVIY